LRIKELRPSAEGGSRSRFGIELFFSFPGSGDSVEPSGVNAGTETIGISLAHQFQLGSLRILRKGRSSHESDLFLWKKLREHIAVAQVVEPGDGQHSRDFRSQSSPECFRLQATIMAEANPGQGNAKGTRLGWTRVIQRYSWCEKQVPVFGRNDNYPQPSRKKNTAGVTVNPTSQGLRP
jgi:hypothetical protein